VRILDEAVVLDQVQPGSPAARAGLRTGFLVLAIGGVPAADVIAQARRGNEREPVQRMRAERALLGLLDGAPGSSVRVRFQDGAGKVREAEIERVERRGELTPELANIPPQHLEFEARRIGEAGYIRFNWFLMPLMDRIGPAIREFHDTRGIVIDVRGNPGGLGILSAGIAGLLETEEGSLGVMRMRSGHMNLAVFPQGKPYRGAVVILIDHASMSTSEILAAGLQEHGRAVVMGERSSGAALSSFIQKLPTGGFFQFAIADFQTPRGVRIEGRGVVPDVEVRPDRASLLAGRDAPLEQALQYIERSGRNAQ
jgi:carboxyl-terminal processing protease